MFLQRITKLKKKTVKNILNHCEHKRILLRNKILRFVIKRTHDQNSSWSCFITYTLNFLIDFYVRRLLKTIQCFTLALNYGKFSSLKNS